jgi:hypothetical protein
MSSFLSTLMENEELRGFEIIVDNCKPDHNNSSTSLVFLEQEPKCRWHNMVSTNSDLSLSTRGRNRSRSKRLSVNRPSMKNRRSSSDPCLDLPMPKRSQSPNKNSPRIASNNISSFSSDSQLLRIPQRLPSPTTPKKAFPRRASKSGSNNASWDRSDLKKKTETSNMFCEIVVETGDLAKGVLPQASRPYKTSAQSRKFVLAKPVLDM